MISNKISSIWITLNPSDLCSFFVLILARVRLEDNRSATSAGEFGRVMAIMNLLTIAQFFKATYTSIFNCLFAAGFTEGGLLGPLSTYFGIVKTND